MPITRLSSILLGLAAATMLTGNAIAQHADLVPAPAHASTTVHAQWNQLSVPQQLANRIWGDVPRYWSDGRARSSDGNFDQFAASSPQLATSDLAVELRNGLRKLAGGAVLTALRVGAAEGPVVHSAADAVRTGAFKGASELMRSQVKEASTLTGVDGSRLGEALDHFAEQSVGQMEAIDAAARGGADPRQSLRDALDALKGGDTIGMLMAASDAAEQIETLQSSVDNGLARGILGLLNALFADIDRILADWDAALKQALKDWQAGKTEFTDLAKLINEAHDLLHADEDQAIASILSGLKRKADAHWKEVDSHTADANARLAKTSDHLREFTARSDAIVRDFQLPLPPMTWMTAVNIDRARGPQGAIAPQRVVDIQVLGVGGTSSDEWGLLRGVPESEAPQIVNQLRASRGAMTAKGSEHVLNQIKVIGPAYEVTDLSRIGVAEKLPGNRPMY